MADRIGTCIENGKWEEAEQLLSAVADQSQEDPNWHYQRGLVLGRLGDAQGAIDALGQAVELDENHLEAEFRLAYELDLHGEEDEAIAIYEECAAHTPPHVNALMNLAVLYEDRGAYEAAEACLKKVLATYPNHVRALMYLKDVQSSLNMYYDEDQERVKEKRDAILDTAVTDFELSVRSRNCLKKMNIFTLGDLLRANETELLAYKNFGETSLNEIKAMLSQKSLLLGQTAEGLPRGPEFAAPARPPASPPVPTSLTPRTTPPLPGAPDVFNKTVGELELSVRSRKCLQRLNIQTLGDLVAHSEADLLGTKNFGHTSLHEIKQRLSEHGLSLRKASN